MLRSFYIAGTGMLVQREKMDVLTNNITNIDTTGYKKDKLISSAFKDMLIKRTDDPYILSRTNLIGPQNTGVHIEEIVTSFKQGNMEQTDRMEDLALENEGFFVIETAEGNRYTRSGNFSVDVEGYLVNSDGLYVMGENGRINVGENDFTADAEGNIYINETLTDKIKIVTFDDLAGLRKEADNLYSNYSAGQERAAAEVKVKQGYLESSNVDMAQEMVDMMAYSRAYEINQRVLKMLDSSLEKTVNQVGKV